MLETAIVIIGPAMVLGIMGFIVAPMGLVWSPFAALTTWRMARNRGLDGGRYALAGATSSIFMLLPWLLLVIGLRKGRLHPTAVQYMYIFVHLVWLVGPIAVCGQLVASLDSLNTPVVFAEDVDTNPPNPVVVYSGFGLMLTVWIVSASMTAAVVWNSRFRGELEEIVGFRYLIPFVGAWACTLTYIGYAFSQPE